MVVAEYSTGTHGFGNSDGPQSTEPCAIHKWAVKFTVAVAEIVDVTISYVTLGCRGKPSSVKAVIVPLAVRAKHLIEMIQNREVHAQEVLMESIADGQT